MVRCEMKYEGGLRTRAQHGPSGAEFVTDAPVDNHGKGEAFSPTDLLGTALGTCVLTLMGIRAGEFDRELGAATVVVDKKMKATPMRHIGVLDVVIQIPGEWDQDQREALEAAALGCPVRASLSERVKVQMKFEWLGTSRL